MPVVYLVSGANRGIGLGLVCQLSERPNTVIFAGARNPDAAAELKKLVEAKPGVVHVLKLTSGDVTDNAAAAETVKSVAGRLDVVIANAGINNYFAGVFDSPVSEYRKHWDVNVGGPHVLFQQTLPLLRTSPRDESNPPKFVIISSTAGSLALAEHMGNGIFPYRSLKASANYLAFAIHLEHANDGLVAFPICPGPVETDGFYKVRANDENVAKLTASDILSVDTSVTGLLTVIDKATRETHGGKFVNYAEKDLPW